MLRMEWWRFAFNSSSVSTRRQGMLRLISVYSSYPLQHKNCEKRQLNGLGADRQVGKGHMSSNAGSHQASVLYRGQQFHTPTHPSSLRQKKSRGSHAMKNDTTRYPRRMVSFAIVMLGTGVERYALPDMSSLSVASSDAL
jgi:hypothetical protein